MKKVWIILAVILVIIQFFRIDKTNPPVNQQSNFITINHTPESVAKIIQTSCYDCHSNESKYPWYTNVSPISWFAKHHIDEGRRELNFSVWGDYEPKRQAKKMKECVEQITEGEMPLASYTIIHQDAKLTDAQKKELTDYFSTLQHSIMTENGITDEDLKKKHK